MKYEVKEKGHIHFKCSTAIESNLMLVVKDESGKVKLHRHCL